MPQRSLLKFPSTSICGKIGMSQLPEHGRTGVIETCRQNSLEGLEEAQQQRDIPTTPEPKWEYKLVRICSIPGGRTVETKNDPDDIDPLCISRLKEGRLCPYSKLVYSTEAGSQQKEGFVRAIPHFDRLFNKTQSYLPRYIFRVVHSKSAGKVSVDEHGLTHFWSHARLQNESSTDFKNFDFQDVTEQLKCHISGWKSAKKKPFASHFISTTDSFEFAIHKAQRHHSDRSIKNVMIYVVDTHTLQRPALVFLMALAFRAWNVSLSMSAWKEHMLKHGALTEWIFWDEIVATKVEKIEYGTLACPQRSENGKVPPCLEDVIRPVIEATKTNASIKKRKSRPAVHATLYSSPEQEIERQNFRLGVRATRNGPLPRAPPLVQRDRRVQIDDKILQDVWNIVRALKSRNLLFIWILSLMTRTYYAEHTVERVIERYPEVVENSLELIMKSGDTSIKSEKILVFYMSALDCLGRADVNEYQKMMVACVQEWHRRVQATTDHKYCGIKLYVVTGTARPSRNLIQPREIGYLGKCTTEPLLRHTEVILCSPSFSQIVSSIPPLVLPETDEEHRLRIQRQTGNKFYAPGGIPMVITRGVRNDDSHRTVRARPGPGISILRPLRIQPCSHTLYKKNSSNWHRSQRPANASEQGYKCQKRPSANRK